MVKYIKCPRCELNYIDGETQEYCDVCIAEMKGNRLQFADLDDEELEDELAEEATELCSICGVNRVRYGEKICEACASKAEYEEEEEIDPEKDEEWKNYLDDDTEDLTVDDEELEEELKQELDDEEEEESVDDDDFFDEDVDSLSDLEDEDYDDDDEDEDDDDDDLF
ncbi:MAG: hypothetical protein ACI4L9_03655 [Candidatus Coproplasma sp.]